MDDFRLAHIVSKSMHERTNNISEYLVSGQLKSMDEYKNLMGVLGYIEDLKEDIERDNKERKEDD